MTSLDLSQHVEPSTVVHPQDKYEKPDLSLGINNEDTSCPRNSRWKINHFFN